ncbi:MAG: hypothetical protein WC370_11120 [Dehalococcoidales bacterium]|jgi:hypothetical protein
MLQELTIEYNMANWREAMASLESSNKYPHDLVYSFNVTSASEEWLFQNSEALAAVQRGLNDAAEGRVSRVNLKNL